MLGSLRIHSTRTSSSIQVSGLLSYILLKAENAGIMRLIFIFIKMVCLWNVSFQVLMSQDTNDQFSNLQVNVSWTIKITTIVVLYYLDSSAQSLLSCTIDWDHRPVDSIHSTSPARVMDC